MHNRTAARIFYGVTVATVVLAIVLQIPLTASNEETEFATAFGRVTNLFLYFTILSNILVAVVAGLLLRSGDRRSTWFAALSLATLVNITITGIVYWIALAGLQDNEGVAILTNWLFHTIVPVLGVVGWALWAPRGLVSRRVIMWSTVIPLAWLAMALIRGAIIDWYPYPFIDVNEVGYPSALLAAGAVAAFFLVLAAIAGWVDGRLGRAAEQPA